MKPLQKSVRESLEQATTVFHNALMAGGADHPGVAYLRGRGIDRSSAERFRLGYVAEGLPGFERFVGRVSIPNICAAGRVVGMKFRATDDETEPKYDGLSLPVRLFNLQALNEAETVLWVTEGELDAISLGTLGVPAVAVPGASSWTQRHARILEGFDRVVLIQDDDQAGTDLAKRMGQSDLPLLVVRPPHGAKDVNAALVAGRVDELTELIERTKA